MIGFNEIGQARVPFSRVEFNNSDAVSKSATRMKSLIIAPAFHDSTGPDKKLISVESPKQIGEMFGVGSAVHEMTETFKLNNKTSDLWIVALKDTQNATSASLTLSFTLHENQSGTKRVKDYPFTFKIGGHRISVILGKNDEFQTFHAKLKSKIDELGNYTVRSIDGASVAGNTLTEALENAESDKEKRTDKKDRDAIKDKILNFATSGNNLTIDTTHKGEFCNELNLEVIESLGVSSVKSGQVDLKNTLASFSGGAINADIDDAFDALGDEHFHTLISPFNDATNLGKVDTKLSVFFDANTQREGHYWTARHDTLAELKNYTNGKTTSKHISIFGYHHSVSSAWNWIAGIAATSVKALEIDPARPLKTLRVLGIEAPQASSRFNSEKRNDLLYKGISTQTYDTAGNVYIELPITAYKNPQDESDDSYLMVNSLYTLFEIRRRFNSLWLRKYPRHKLGSDEGRYKPGQPIMTPSLARTETVAFARELEEDGLIENVDLFIEDLIVERDSVNRNRLNFMTSPDIINQLLQIAHQVRFIN